MEARLLNRENLKLIACGTMLLDHIGAVLLPGMLGLRIFGRISFPTYCFLLAEGARHTRDAARYGARLLAVAVLSELPYDLALHGGWNWGHQNVMFTLVLGLVACRALGEGTSPLGLAVAAGCMVAAETAKCSYGAMGVGMILLFFLTESWPKGCLVQALGLVILGWDSAKVWGGIPIQTLSVFAMLPLVLYGGRKAISSRWVQWMFYLFYPAHLLAVY